MRLPRGPFRQIGITENRKDLNPSRPHLPHHPHRRTATRGAIAVAQVGGNNDRAITSTSTTIDDSGGDRPAGVSDDSPGDLSGPCDEAEHADDRRCTGVTGTTVVATDDDTPGDLSGPCDEAEHADDRRCTGGVGSDDASDESSEDDTVEDRSDDSDDDNSGRGSDDGEDHDDDDSSGRGSDDDEDESEDD